jgi:Asp-tRNA(Asn)/Glu-tRNA(Gln) amidotransferase A subunit family amidase
VRISLLSEKKWCSAQVKETDVARHRIKQHVTDLLGSDGILMLPTAPRPAPLLKAADSDPALRLKIISLTCIAGLAGLPQVVGYLPAQRCCGGDRTVFGGYRSSTS